MGGGSVTPSSTTSEEESSEDQDSQNSSWFLVDGTNNEVFFGELDQAGSRFPSSASLEFEAERRRKYMVYNEVLRSYDQLGVRTESLTEAKSKLFSYYPGAWIGNMGGMKLSDYDVPEATTLVLIGPKGCGKSSLVNRISRALEDDKFAPKRAQVSYNSSVGDGTCFLQEYIVPRGSTSFCLYDTRSLSDDPTDNIDMITNWMTRGVCHGELVLRKSDVPSLRSTMKCNTREKVCQSSKIRIVNFVIFVVDGVAVLKSIEGDGNGMTKYMQTITTTFNCPYLSLKDDKPAVVVTHGDLLALADRVRVLVHLGELLGIPPEKQIFDIPGNSDAATELTIVDMLRYSLEHADRNLPLRNVESSYPTIHQEENLHNKFEEKKTDEGKKQSEGSSYQIIHREGNLHNKLEKEERTNKGKKPNKESSSQTNHRQGNNQNKSGKEKKADQVDIMVGVCVLSSVIFALVMAVFLIKDESEPHIDCLQNKEVKDSKYGQGLARRIRDEDGVAGSHIVRRNTDTNDEGAKLLGSAMEKIIGNQPEEWEKAGNKNEDYRKVSGERSHVAAIGLDYVSAPKLFGNQKRVEGNAELARRIKDDDGATGSHIVQRNKDNNERRVQLPGRAMEKIIGDQSEEMEKTENKNEEYMKVSTERNPVAAIDLDYASIQEFFVDLERVEEIAELARRIKVEAGATGSYIVQTNAETDEREATLHGRAREMITGNQSEEMEKDENKNEEYMKVSAERYQSEEMEKAENKNEEYMKVNAERSHVAAIDLDYASVQEFFGDQKIVEEIAELARRIKDEDGVAGRQIVQMNTDTNERGAKLPGRAMEKIIGNQSEEMGKSENKNEEYMNVNRERNHVAAIGLDVQFFGDQKRVGVIANPVDKKDVGKQMKRKEKNKHKEIGGKRDKGKDKYRVKKSKSKGKRQR